MLKLPVDVRACRVCRRQYSGTERLCPVCRVYRSFDAQVFKNYVARGCKEGKNGTHQNGQQQPGADWAWEKEEGINLVNSTKKCTECGETFKARNALQTMCGTETCDRARSARYARESYARKHEQKQKAAPRPAPTPEPAPATPSADAGAVAVAAVEELALPAVVTPPEPEQLRDIEEELAPVMAFVAELQKALALMPTVAGATLSLTVRRNGSVAITPPSFLPLK